MKQYLILFILSLLVSACRTGSDPRPNIIYICIEDMSPYLGCYGFDAVHSPCIDEFAHESVLFEDVHCQVALCTPSRTSIMTGIRPSTSGIVKIDDDWKAMLPGAVSLPRHLKDHGYFTCRVGKITDPRSGGPDSAWTVSVEEWGVTDNQLIYRALDEVASSGEPFFLAAGYKQAHEPWTPSQKSLDLYDVDEISLLGPHRVYKGDTLTGRQARELLMSYYATITDVDRHIGDLLEYIREKGLYDKSIIMVGVFDHGFGAGTHNKWGKGRVEDTYSRVPMLVRVPGNRHNGERASGLVELVDIYPAVLELTGLPDPPQELEGISFVPLLEDPHRTWKKAAICHRAYGVDIIGVKTKQYTLVDYAGDSLKLFDRKTDPDNKIDISHKHPELVREMQEIF